MEENEKQTYKALRPVITNFMGNKKGPYYKNIVGDMFEKFQKLGCNISLKIPFLYSHLDYFPENLTAVSKEQGEGFFIKISKRCEDDTRYMKHADNSQLLLVSEKR